MGTSLDLDLDFTVVAPKQHRKPVIVPATSAPPTIDLEAVELPQVNGSAPRIDDNAPRAYIKAGAGVYVVKYMNEGGWSFRSFYQLPDALRWLDWELPTHIIEYTPRAFPSI